jgi:hypothetical protein
MPQGNPIKPTSGGGGERMPRLEPMSTDDKPTSASEDMKRKFKEALDKKNAQSREGEAHLDGDSAVHGTHGAVTKREFRRKSG